MEKQGKLRVELSVTNIIVSESEATATVNLKGIIADSLRIDTVELTGLLYKMIDACKQSFESNSIIYIPEPKIKKEGKHYRVWTDEEKQRALETRKKKAMIANLTSNNSENKENLKSDFISGSKNKKKV